MNNGLKKIRYFIEAGFAYIFFSLFKLLPLSLSSNIGGFIARNLGRISKTDKIAFENLKHAFPNKSDKEIREILTLCWDNLGRTATEFPKVAAMDRDQLEEICRLEGVEIFDKYKSQNKGVVVISAHYGNWELASRYLLEIEPRTALIYRKANNPYVEKLIQKARSNYTSFIIQKGDNKGIRDIVKHLKNDGSLGNLADQKLREGIEIEFFGRKVKAPVTAVELAKKFDLPIIMARLVRDESKKYSNFKFIFEELENYKDLETNEIIQNIYYEYEKWLKEYPSQWFWMHSRWKK
jgi:KDO2-lipid IV(A) lauroyltransferase